MRKFLKFLIFIAIAVPIIQGCGGDRNNRTSPTTGRVENVLITFASAVPISGSAQEVDFKGNTVFVATTNGVDVIDVSDPSSPNLITTLNLGTAHDVEVEGNKLYVATSGGLVVYDITSPSNPLEVERISTPYELVDVEISNNIPYATYQSSSGSGIVKIRSAGAIENINLSSSPSIGGLFLQDNYAIVTTKEGVVIVNVSNSSMSLEKTVPISGNSCDFRAGDVYSDFIACGNTMYVVDTPFDLPSADIQATLSFNDNIADIEFLGYSFLVIAGWTEGIHVVDVNNPINPRLVTTVKGTTPLLYLGVAVDRANRRIYVASTIGQLHVFHFSLE